MLRVEMGTRVKSVGISRIQVASGFKGKAVLLDKCVSVKQIAYDQEMKRAIEVSQEACIKLKLTPRTIYYMLVAQLNTDPQGNVIGDTFTVGYLQMSDSVYASFIDLQQENDNFSILTLKKVTRSENDQFGYTSAIPSTNMAGVSDNLKEEIKKIRHNKAMIKSLWDMVDIATSITVQKYCELLQAAGKPVPEIEGFSETPQVTAAPIQSQPQQKVISVQPTTPVAAKNPVEDADFGSVDDFPEEGKSDGDGF